MKVALLGDTHIGARNDSPSFHKHFAKFYNEVFFPYLEQHNILHVVQLGDVFDRRKYINFNSLKQSREYLFDRLNKDYQTWMLVGNHDTYFKDTNNVNSLELLLDGYYNITPVHHCMDVMFEDVPFLLVPWWCQDNNQHITDTLTQTSATHVIGHFEIDGFEMYKGSVHQGGTTKKLFENFEAVYSGHFHHRSSHGNIHYLGTPYEMTWSDYDDQKGFHVFDTDTRELTFIPNPSSIFHKIHYDDTDRQISDVVNIDFSKYNETFVKLIVRNKTNPYCFDMFVDKLEKAGVYNVQVVDDHFHMDTIDDSDITSDAEDTLTILTKFVNQIDSPVDKKQLESLMITLYNEALSVE
jgi:DNA repair exonuclease SbcCD nuclease subunit